MWAESEITASPPPYYIDNKYWDFIFFNYWLDSWLSSITNKLIHIFAWLVFFIILLYTTNVQSILSAKQSTVCP